MVHSLMLLFWEFGILGIWEFGNLGIGRLSYKLQKQLINELFSENGLEYSITRTTIAGTQRVGINPSIFDNEKGNLQSGLFERPDGGNVLIIINSLNDQQAFTVDHPDFGQLKMQVQPHSFNTWIYYKQTFKIK